jgi:hypothetical protein
MLQDELYAQDLSQKIEKHYALVIGYVKDSKGFPLAEAFVKINDSKMTTLTDENGFYSLKVESGKPFTIYCSYASFNKMIKVPALKESESFKWDITFEIIELDPAVIKPDRIEPSIIVLDPRKVDGFPTHQFESVLKHVGLGVAQSGGELSSAFNVRGGNFDENLIYVNDIEVYRPFLIRSGQQEGLSFINQDMVNNLSFSAGGWQAQYGDKMASVLDVQYRTPKKFGSTLKASLLGTEWYIEDKRSPRFSYLFGARYRTNRYLLNTLNVQGNYKPFFADAQGLFTYKLKKDLSIQWLTNVSFNRFLLQPQSQSTSFGTVRDALRLDVAFGGQELMQYLNSLNAITFKYQPNLQTEIKWISSYFTDFEREQITVEGAYELSLLENNLGSGNFATPKLVLGAGYFINNARNDLEARVWNSGLIGRHNHKSGVLKWGVKFQNESIVDRLKEWRYNDSAGYSITLLPRNPDEIILDRYVNAKIDFQSLRVMGYVQNTQTISAANNLRVNYGLRSSYWTFNNQNLISPRIQLSFEPNKKFNDTLRKTEHQNYDSLKKKDLMLTAAFGYYYQPPFYRELRNFDGDINHNLKAQRSIHFVLGCDINFLSWNRPFKWISEAYLKKMDDLVPYALENVRIRYYAQNSSKGYATGFDTRLNGEFIRGLESWFNFSLLFTRENISYENDSGEISKSGYIRRPTDQRMSFSILFQDALPMDPSFKMHLNLIYGSSLPYYLIGNARYKEGLTIPAYRRVDIGFSKTIVEEDAKKERKIKALWLSIEVFNLLQINNTISYIWIKDINNQTYGVPNFLTGRRLNFKIMIKI